MIDKEQRSKFRDVLDEETGKLLLRYDRKSDTIQVKPKWATTPRLVDMKRLREGPEKG